MGGRRILVRNVGGTGEIAGCHILFIGDSEGKQVAAFLDRAKDMPILTVGETESFLDGGGMIHFVKREEKIRLEINLAPAREAGLQISSKVLSVADVVRGKR